MLTIALAIFIFNGISGKIQGTVKDKDTHEPIPYADVMILGTEIGAATDEEGNFYILNVHPGRYTVEVSYISYQTKYIEDVLVEIDQTARLNVFLKQTTIEIEPITVKGETPAIRQDMVGAKYIIKRTDIGIIPIDYATDIVSFQPSVVHFDTVIHVRGGRATEVQYMIDNVSIIDPQTGDLAVNISKGIVDEIIFLPGTFDAEYGRAMSGVINLITEHPADRLCAKVYGKTERIMPYYYDFGYETFQSSIHLPVSRKFKGFLSFDLMHTDDWNPKLFIQPHKQRDDYSVYGKWVFAPSGKLRLSLSGAKSLTQFDRYEHKWRYNLDNYRSDMRHGNLQVLNLNFLPDSRKFFNLTLSRLHTNRIFGVTESGDYGPFDNFTFKDYNTLKWPSGGIRNPFGIHVAYMPLQGDYYEYQDKSSLVMKANFNAVLQIHKYHEVKTGFEYAYQSFDNFTHFLTASTLNPAEDEYCYNPEEYSLFFQDNIDYETFYAKIGCRYDYFSSGIEDTEPKIIISPRLGFSLMVTDKFLFRANIGRYAQPPLYDYMYGYYSIWPFPSYIIGMKNIPPIGNPDLDVEKTISFEIGLQGEVRENMVTTINAFYKDVSDLVGIRIIDETPKSYAKYFNTEYANIKGLETVVNFTGSIFTGKISYTLSWARGTSSYAREIYYRYYYDQDTIEVPPAEEYDLDFDQRHRIFVQGVIDIPFQTKVFLFGYFGNGFPYTPPGDEGKTSERNALRLSYQRQFDCVISKSLKIGKISLTANLEIMNLLDARYEIYQHAPIVPLENIRKENFASWIPYSLAYYSPETDLNHDGLVAPNEMYLAYRSFVASTDDWISANSAPRRARIGVTITFQ